jgi:hypothetical protein
MYTVVVTDHFEDWHVAYETIGEYYTFEEAIRIFSEECRNLLDHKFYFAGIDRYISEHLQDSDDDEIDDMSKGFLVSINSGDETIVSRHFDYDHKSHLIVGDYVIELNDECLTSKEALKIRQSLTLGSSGSL